MTEETKRDLARRLAIPTGAGSQLWSNVLAAAVTRLLTTQDSLTLAELRAELQTVLDDANTSTLTKEAAKEAITRITK